MKQLHEAIVVVEIVFEFFILFQSKWNTKLNMFAGKGDSAVTEQCMEIIFIVRWRMDNQKGWNISATKFYGHIEK